jgi:hypothetical protein
MFVATEHESVSVRVCEWRSHDGGADERAEDGIRRDQHQARDIERAENDAFWVFLMTPSIPSEEFICVKSADIS